MLINKVTTYHDGIQLHAVSAQRNNGLLNYTKLKLFNTTSHLFQRIRDSDHGCNNSSLLIFGGLN